MALQIHHTAVEINLDLPGRDGKSKIAAQQTAKNTGIEDFPLLDDSSEPHPAKLAHFAQLGADATTRTPTLLVR